MGVTSQGEIALARHVAAAAREEFPPDTQHGD